MHLQAALRGNTTSTEKNYHSQDVNKQQYCHNPELSEETEISQDGGGLRQSIVND